MECSPTARLLFIGLWNFCDDGGCHPASAKTLKAEVFPGDDISSNDVQALIKELVEQGLLNEYEIAGKPYWCVTGWHHQKIDKPTFKYPRPPEFRQPFAEESPNHSPPTRLGVAESSPPEGKGEDIERKRSKPVSDETGSHQAKPDDLPSCPHQEIIKLYAKHLPELPQPKAWDGQRENNLKARWRWVLTAKKPSGDHYATDAATALGFFDRFFGYVAKSDFLTGRNVKWQSCNLAWLVKAENFAKVIEGHYENREAT